MSLLINHQQYLEPEYYGTALNDAAENIDNLIVERSWCDNDARLDTLDYAIENAKLNLFNLAGDACLRK